MYSYLICVRNWTCFHCATSWRIAGLIPIEVIGMFYRVNPSGHTMSPGVKVASAKGLQPCHLHVPIV